jgi:hypothetical protein
VIFAWLACASLAHASSDLVLAPGSSVTLIDEADPSMHVVVTAPADAPLDLGALIAASGKTNILSIVTAAQVKRAGALVKHADGTITIAPATAAPVSQVSLIDRAVLVFNEGRYVGVAQQTPVAALGAASASAPTRETMNLGALISGAASRSAVAIPSSTPVPASLSSSPSRLPGPAPITAGSALINPATNVSLGQNAGVITWGQFSINSTSSITVQPSSSAITLIPMTGKLPTAPTTITTTGSITLTAPSGASASSISVGGASVTSTGAPAPTPSFTFK